MSESMQKLTIRINAWPSRNDIQEFLSGSSSKAEIRAFLQQEYDTEISFRVGGLDLLSGYKEAFILPLHAFLKSLHHGLKALATSQEAKVPIYLQQYKIEEGDRSHLLLWKIDSRAVVMGFQWGGFKEAPPFLRDLGELRLSLGQMSKEIGELINEYGRCIAALLGPLPEWSGDEISSIFTGF